MPNLEQLFFTIRPGVSNKYSRFWLAIAILFSLIYSCMALPEAFSDPYVVQDDARQHVFWMSRWLDRDLFPDDLIADYFQSIAPIGYQLIYAIPALFKIDPLVVSKILPSILGVVTTFYCFVLTMELLPIPFTGFMATLLLNQNLWLQDGLISGTPKAFAIPLLLAFLAYYLKHSLSGTSITIFLMGFFYPSLVFICSGLLILHLWELRDSFLKYKGQLFQKYLFKNYFFCFIGLVSAFLVLLSYGITTSEFASTITLSQAKALPDFAQGGRSFFFDAQNSIGFWLNGSRSGLRISSALMPPPTYFAFLLPVLLRAKLIFPLGQKVTANIKVLRDLILVSLVMFGLAHLLLFKLHLPSRYTQNSLRIIFAIASGISITLIIHSLSQIIINSLVKTFLLKRLFAKLSLVFLGLLLVVYPHLTNNFVWTQYEKGHAVELYKFLQRQPKDIMVASLTYEADNIPTFARRSILVSQEYAIPYHTGYYFPYRQRAIDLINASYSSDLGVVRKFIHQYKIDFFLTEESSFTPGYITSNAWIQQHQPAAKNAVNNLERNIIPALQNEQNNCTLLKVKQFNLISTDCILAVQK